MSGDDGQEPSRGPGSPESAGSLLVSDVDGTLTGDPSALSRLLDAVDGVIIVVLSSSRPVDSVRRTLVGFPGSWMPLGIIGALGTEIELAGHPDRTWNRGFSAWDRAPVDTVMEGLGFEPHPDEHQTPAKASFAVPIEDRDRARDALDRAGVVATVMASGIDDFDVLAPGAGKGPAARRVAERLGFPEDHVATAGDALIDVDMLRFGRGILVGNATEEARAALEGHPVYRAHAPYAAGVMEGLRAVGALAAEARR